MYQLLTRNTTRCCVGPSCSCLTRYYITMCYMYVLRSCSCWTRNATRCCVGESNFMDQLFNTIHVYNTARGGCSCMCKFVHLLKVTSIWYVLSSLTSEITVIYHRTAGYTITANFTKIEQSRKNTAFIS